MSSHFLLQEIFLTQGSNLGLSHCRQILYSLSHQERLVIQSALPTARGGLTAGQFSSCLLMASESTVLARQKVSLPLPIPPLLAAAFSNTRLCSGLGSERIPFLDL